MGRRVETENEPISTGHRSLGDVPRPVPSDTYTTEYYLTGCSGADEFESGEGMAVAPILAELLDRMEVGPERTCLDLGCGRGEVALNCAARGARILALDYADAALDLARGALARHTDLEERVVLVQGDAKHLPVPTGSVDRAFLLDIVEHLHPWELTASLAELRRVMSPGGVALVHTMPNLHYYRWVYPVLRVAAAIVQRHRVPREPRGEYELTMHVNEQTPRRLRTALESAGFSVEMWLTGLEKCPLRPGRFERGVRLLAGRPPLRTVASFHILALARPR